MLIPSSAQVSDKTQLCAQGLRLAGLAGGEGAQVPELQLHETAQRGLHAGQN